MKDLINPDLDLNKIQSTFKEKGYVVIDNYLKDKAANKLNNYFTNEMPPDWWSVATFPSKNSDKVSYFRNVPEENINIQNARQHSIEAFGKNQFSYSFYRTLDDHFKECECIECQVREFLDSNESLDFISKATELNIKGSNEVFTACYLPGDFLSPHQDSPNGKIGFVLQLTKNWRPEYGGLLHFLNDDGDVVENVEVPKFNSLTLFLLPEDKGKLHYVSNVNPGAPGLRLSLTGWFKD